MIRRDHAFLFFLVSGALAYLVYVAFETVLPISAVNTHGIAPSVWGLIVIINPACVTLFQLRVIRWTSGIPSGPKFVTAMLLMGGSFLFLLLSGSAAMFVVVLLVFVTGEMLWVPTSQAIVARLAPADIRGAYMGAFGSTSSVGFALGPFAGLQLRGALRRRRGLVLLRGGLRRRRHGRGGGGQGAAGRRVSPAPAGS